MMITLVGKIICVEDRYLAGTEVATLSCEDQLRIAARIRSLDPIFFDLTVAHLSAGTALHCGMEKIFRMDHLSDYNR